jgi:hypothetical protein
MVRDYDKRDQTHLPGTQTCKPDHVYRAGALPNIAQPIGNRRAGECASRESCLEWGSSERELCGEHG